MGYRAGAAAGDRDRTWRGNGAAGCAGDDGVIPRSVVAEALGLPADTDALPPGDLPADRFAARLIAYLATPNADGRTPDAWTGGVLDRLIADDPALALEILALGARLDGAEVLSDALADLAMRDAGTERAIAHAASTDPQLTALIVLANG